MAENISFDRAAEYYDDTRGFAPGVPEQVRDAIVRLTGATRASRFLELGVGTGRIALPFIQAGYDYTGVDISEAMMERLRQKLAADHAHLSYTYRLEQADIASLPYADDAFDVILAVHVFHLIKEPLPALQEARRVLARPGGWLLLANDAPTDQTVDDSSPGYQVNRQWQEILVELGETPRSRPPGDQSNDLKLKTLLEDLGANVEVKSVTENAHPAISARQMADRHKARMYSSDWTLSEAVHSEAVARLDKWLTEECANPDQPVSNPGQLKAVVARWQ